MQKGTRVKVAKTFSQRGLNTVKQGETGFVREAARFKGKSIYADPGKKLVVVAFDNGSRHPVPRGLLVAA